MSKKFVLKFNGFDVIVGIVSCFIACVLLLVNNFAFSNKVKLDDKVAFIYYNSNKLEDYTIYFKEL